MDGNQQVPVVISKIFPNMPGSPISPIFFFFLPICPIYLVYLSKYTKIRMHNFLKFSIFILNENI